MSEQIPLSDDASAVEPELDAARRDHTHEVAPDLAYRRLGIVNVIFVGPSGAGDREWVLIDAGLTGTAGLIRSAAQARFGEGSRPAAIVMTHGHFDHVGALEQLAEEWDAPVYAHPLEHPYLNGSAAYPPADPSVGGGLMARLSRLYPRSPVDVGARLRPLPEDGSVPFMPGWRWVHTPGHSVGHVSLWRDGDRALIVGDAFCTTGQESAYDVALQEPQMHGPPMYFTIDWEAAEESVKKLAALGPELAVTFHGQPMRGPEMRAALHRLAREFRAVAVPEKGEYVARARRAGDGSAYEKA
ncbi:MULTISPECIES: MBL fold metallo-hydrolase [unclassified Paracoccus (in: a-proteobacteria)]|uniref:MBL fold metallo-hydrolase n=1 Tax=unclassified Paracoccus (in: a-proteobacteria) TaxID=2688777 RepID=UPI0016015FFB|nr:MULTISPECIES: MBL fold metallo-hydrolase [unclassified Paracoccus (in: a-proteobacteria)]MBB1491400.1 MBL fold metallo-hydrolase [Paracoccus sp. MC1854]MBB1499514.1 MBL fold metallo-hydrolase [Paracoccus sp. MC1862]QQO46117.1 MBL fold metallo-hydrolase [Paracoccus sp. MC1862]